MRVAIVTSGYFPVPPTYGGAVECLIQELIEQNESSNKIDFVIYSCFEEQAASKAKQFTKSDFIFIKTPALIRVADYAIYFAAKYLFHKKKHMSYRYILQRLHYIKRVGLSLSSSPVDRIVFENHPTLLRALRVKDNRVHYANKYLYHMHNVFSDFYGCRQELLDCRKVLGVSRYTLRELNQLCEGELANTQLTVLKNRVDETKFSRSVSEECTTTLRKKHSLSPDTKVVLFAGRLNQEKGAFELIESFQRIQDKSAVLLILGSYYYGLGITSQYESNLRFASSSLNRRIVFTGYVDYKDMPSYYALADIVVAPSIWNDPAPLSVIEPLTAGRPLITTDRGGIPEYASNGVDSILLEVNNSLVDNLTNAIDALLNHTIQLRESDASKWNSKSYFEDFVREVTE